MLKRLPAFVLCLILSGEPFAAELPTALVDGAEAVPVREIALPVLPELPRADVAAQPVQLELPLPGIPGAAAAQIPAARAPAPSAQAAVAAARRIVASSATPQARASATTARAVGDEAFDDQRAFSSPAGEPVAAAEGSGAETLAPSSDSAAEGRGRPPTPPRVAKPAAWKVWVPHAITGLNLTSGLASMLFAAHGMLLPAAGLIVLAAVFDAFDGLVARKLGVAGPMGTMMDSQADGVSFGAAPAILAFSGALEPLARGHLSLAVAGFAFAAFSAFAAAYRLSRYNLDALAAGSGNKPPPFFKGLPSPGGAAALIALTFALPALPVAAAFAVAAVGTVVVGAAMMSTLPYLKITTDKKTLLISAAAAAAIAAPFVALGAAALAPAAVLGAYLLSGPAIALYRGGSDVWKKELKRKAFHQTNLLFLAAFLGLKFVVGGPWTVGAFVAASALIGFAEYCRLYGTKLRSFLERSGPLKRGFAWLEGLLRARERGQPSGVFFGITGATIAAGVAVLAGDWRLMAGAILALTFGDALSSLVGMRFGWKPYRVNGTLRSADGTAAGFAVAFGIALALGFGPWAALGAAVVFSLVDTYPVKPDDNLWIPTSYPVALAAFGWLAAAFGGPAAGLAALAIGAAGAWLISRKTTRA